MGSDAVSEPGTPEDLEVLADALARADAAMAEAAAAIGRLSGSGVCESAEGLELEHWLRLAAKLPAAQARRVTVTGELLADLPQLRTLLETGAVAYGCVETICTLLRGLSADQRGVVDQRLAATIAARPHGVEAFGADGLIEAVTLAVDDLRTEATRRRREQRRERASRVVLQPRLDGSGGTAVSDLGPLAWQIHLTALEQAAADALTAGDTPEMIPAATPDEPADPIGRRGGRVSPAQQRALGLRRMAACYLGHPDPIGRPADEDGGTGDPQPEGDHDDDVASGEPAQTGVAARCPGRRGWRPARPLFTAVIDVSDVHTATAAVLLGGRGDLPRLTARLVDALADDADLSAVLFDGATPLATSAIRRARDRRPPAKIRTAVGVRDKGDRFPGSRLGPAESDLDHLTPVAAGGGHDPTNLALINTHTNRAEDRGGWQLSFDDLSPDELVATRRHRRWRSLPRGTPLEPPPPDPEPPPDATPDPLPF